MHWIMKWLSVSLCEMHYNDDDDDDDEVWVSGARWISFLTDCCSSCKQNLGDCPEKLLRTAPSTASARTHWSRNFLQSWRMWGKEITSEEWFIFFWANFVATKRYFYLLSFGESYSTFSKLFSICLLKLELNANKYFFSLDFRKNKIILER